MQIRYFDTAWNDIRNSNGWFGKLCLLALVGLIPVFGQIVILGYMYGWAREIAWGVHEPLPESILGNEDGKLYRRGWFILVLAFVFSLVPAIVMGIGTSMQQASVYGMVSNNGASSGMEVTTGIGGLLYFIGLVGSIFLSILAWIGSMRIAIYDRLSAGFQLSKIWKMFRYDTGGIMRIFGMNLLVGLVLGIIASIIFTILFTVVLLVGIGGVMEAGFSASSFEYMTEAQAMRIFAQFLSSAGFVGVISLTAACFAVSLGSVFVDLLVARALGYWTGQFGVPYWRGQDDPMPFEQGVMSQQPYQPAQGAQSPVAQQPYQPASGMQSAQQPYQQPYQPAQGAQPSVAQQPYQPAQSAQSPVAQQPYQAAQIPAMPDFDQGAMVAEVSPDEQASDGQPSAWQDGDDADSERYADRS